MSVFTESDRIYMQRALELAAIARGRTSPNPLVGCVIVQDREIVGEGYHHQAGTPHAEVHALNDAGVKAEGATAYVTLEPCSHFGRTPPCADALIKAKVGRVIVAMSDPNPMVAGRGIERLRAAGITVDVGLLASKARHMNEAFIKAITTGLPFVLYKSALTLDGKIASETGDSKWVSNEHSRAYSHELRNFYDVIMVGSQTVLRDNPALNCRVSNGRDPIRLVVDGSLSISENAYILSSSSTASCIVATTQAADPEKIARLQTIQGVEVWQYPTSNKVPLENLLRDLVKRGWISVLLEGGGGLAGALIESDLIDKLEFFIAPKLIGGAGPSPLSGLHLPYMTDALEVKQLNVSLDTGDLHITGYLHPLKSSE